MLFKVFSFFLLWLCLVVTSYAHNSAVVLQYHHVSDETPASTTISPAMFKQHIQWLQENEFLILPLPEVINTLKNKQKFKQTKVVAITFDDANRSVCDIAWPILKAYQLPFTLFINSEPVERNFQSQCSWEQLKMMTDSGLMTPANHTHRHLHMISGKLTTNTEEWLQEMREEIINTQELIAKKLSRVSHLFAYPYGEYNEALKTLVNKLGFVGFGQHSGAIGENSDFSALPRFPASGHFANLETLSTKLLSLPFPASFSSDSDNPISYSGNENPPLLTGLIADKKILNSTRCYNNKGEPLQIEINQTTLLVQSAERLEPGRHRYTCTSASSIPERFYWFSHQWLIEENEYRSIGSRFMDLFR